jgi:hypothetical protein
VPIEAIRNKTPSQIRADIEGFAARYVQDWDAWLGVDVEGRPEHFGRILRKWQATRPQAMRRLREEARHGPPFLDNLLEDAREPLGVLTGLTVSRIAEMTPGQNEALNALWAIFSRLPTSGVASCVGITKAILLLTDGRIGPAFDSQVRKKLGVVRPANCSEWLRHLHDIGEDIATFERAHGTLSEAVPDRFKGLAHGRLYDMALGPR